MDIWILVIVLLVISIILFVLSSFVKDDANVEELDRINKEQQDEINELKNRIQALEMGNNTSPQLYNGYTEDDYTDESYVDNYVDDGYAVEVEENMEEVFPVAEEKHEDVEYKDFDIETLPSDDRDEIIRLYSQGYTLNEISHETEVDPTVIREVVDDYIENR